MWNARLDESQDGLKIARRNINNLRYADTTTLMAEGEEDLKTLLMMVKDKSEKTDLRLRWNNLGSWQMEGEKVEAVTDFFFLCYQITSHGDCSHEIKRHFLLGRKAMTNLDSVLKSRNITSLTKVHIVKAMVFPIVMYGCGSWTIKKAEHGIIDAFELWCCRRLLRILWQQGDQACQS